MIATLTIGSRRAGIPSESGSTRQVSHRRCKRGGFLDSVLSVMLRKIAGGPGNYGLRGGEPPSRPTNSLARASSAVEHNASDRSRPARPGVGKSDEPGATIVTAPACHAATSEEEECHPPHHRARHKNPHKAIVARPVSWSIGSSCRGPS